MGWWQRDGRTAAATTGLAEYCDPCTATRFGTVSPPGDPQSADKLGEYLQLQVALDRLEVVLLGRCILREEIEAGLFLDLIAT